MELRVSTLVLFILDSDYIDDKEIARISGFRRAAVMDIQSLAGPRNVNVDLKYNVLCL